MKAIPVRNLFGTITTTALMDGDVEPVRGIKVQIEQAYARQKALREDLRGVDRQIDDLRRDLSRVTFGLEPGALYRMRLPDGRDVDGLLEPRENDPLNSWNLRPVDASGKAAKRVHVVRNIDSLQRLVD